MDWWQLIFALVVITFYVLKHIFAIQQEQQQKKAERPRVRDVVPPAPLEQTEAEVDDARTELDRRIEDAQQRRREREDLPEPVASPLPKRTLPMPATSVTVPRYRPVLEETAVVEVVKLARVVAPAVPVAPKAVAPLDAAPAAPQRHNTSALPQVIELLRNRQSLAVAVVLREVLNGPVSRRRAARR